MIDLCPAAPRIPFGLYIHWPFCRSKCPYCDFNSHVRQSHDEAVWRDALLAELRHWAALTRDTHILATIFFGGGTPSLMAPATVAALVDAARAAWPTVNDLEVSLEANPTSSEAANFAGYAAAGVNRLSLGVQALDDAALKFLGRQHDAAEARGAILLAQRHFPRRSFDLIYARPGQNRADWSAELHEALALGPDHISLYQLTVEPDTGFAAQYARGDFELPHGDLAAALYEDTATILAPHGLTRYEVSNYARAGAACRHNLGYWRYDDYIGIGAGAHGRVRIHGERHATANHRLPERWRAQVGTTGHGLDSDTVLTNEDARHEALLMGLRLAEGVDRARWRALFGDDLLNFIPAQKIATLIGEGDLVLTTATLRATSQGLLRLNTVLAYLLP